MKAAQEVKASEHESIEVPKSKSNIWKKITPFLGLIVVFIMFAVSTGGTFISLNNLQLILLQSIMMMVGGVGATFVMSHGNLDFSLGGELAICAVVGYAISTVCVELTLPMCIITGIACSVLVAVIHLIMRVPSFIAGLCIMFMGRGIVGVMSSQGTMVAPASFTALDDIGFFLIVLVVVFVIGYILFEFTKLGKFNKAIGSNERAAVMSGIPVAKYKILAFVVTGVTVGISAYLSMIRAGGVAATTGTNFETEILISLVLGGISITGGSGTKLRSIIIGALIYMMLGNGLTLWGVDPNLVNVIRGIVFLAAVYMTYDRSSGQMVV